jgi:beta-lactamase class A
MVGAIRMVSAQLWEVGMSIEKQIAELKAQNEDNANRIAELEKQLKKKGPVVPWVGAFMYHAHNDKYFYWTANRANPHIFEIVDDSLHPQFMPNDGVNPWPDDMEVQVMFHDGLIGRDISATYDWSDKSIILGSRPACGWAEYLKERDNG